MAGLKLSFGTRVKAAFSILAGSGGGFDAFEIGWNTMARYSSMPRRAAAQWLRTYGEHPQLRAPVHRIATDVAAVTWSVYKNDREDPKKRTDITHEHPLGRLLNEPNPWHSGIEYRKLLSIYEDINGESFQLMKRAPKAPPEELWAVPPHWTLGLPSEGAPYYRMLFRGTSADVPPEYMIWSQDPDPLDPYNRGLGSAYAVEDEVSQDEYAAKYNLQFFRNGGSPGALFGVPGIDKGQAEQLQAKWDQKVSGLWNNFRSHFLPGDVKAIQLAAPHKDMDYVEGRKFLRQIIFQIFGVPPEILGINESSNRAVADAAIYLYGLLVLTPRLVKMRSNWRRFLVPLYRDPYLDVDFENPVKETNDFKLHQASEGLTRGALTVDEWRAANNWPPLPDGTGNRLLEPQNVSPLWLGAFPGLGAVPGQQTNPLPGR